MESFPKTHFYVLNKRIHTYISKQVYLGQLKLGWAEQMSPQRIVPYISILFFSY